MQNDKLTQSDFLGRGWSFPPRFDARLQEVEMVQAEDDIRESLKVLLSTRLGERIMRPNFGCNLNEYVFENLNVTQKTLIKDLLETAILYHEPRVELENIFLDANEILEGKLIIHIDYIVRATNARTNMVYPFYLIEGTEIN